MAAASCMARDANDEHIGTKRWAPETPRLSVIVARKEITGAGARSILTSSNPLEESKW